MHTFKLASVLVVGTTLWLGLAAATISGLSALSQTTVRLGAPAQEPSPEAPADEAPLMTASR